MLNPFHPDLERKLNQVLANQGRIIHRQNLLHKENIQIMSQLTDAQAALDKASADILKAVSDASAKIDALAAQLANNPTADEVAAVAADLTTVSAGLEAAAAALETKSAPPAPPTA